MAKHIFLQGEKGIGKSTLIRRFLQTYTGEVGGFYTVRTQGVLNDVFTVHLLQANSPAVPSIDNLLFVCGKPEPATQKRFDQLGCQSLERLENCSLLVMDELGPHEAQAAAFRSRVLHLLDGEIPILGVLQLGAESAWPELVHHPKVSLVEITKTNRNEKIENIWGDTVKAYTRD